MGSSPTFHPVPGRDVTAAVGGVPRPDQNITANGPDFTTSTGYWNPDAGSHVMQGWFTWTTSEGATGRGPLRTAATNCPPQGAPVTMCNNTPNSTAQPGSRNRDRPSNWGGNHRNWSGNAPSTSGGVAGEDLSQFVCTSHRTYSFLVRTKLEGQAVVGIDKVLVRGVERYGSFKKVTVRGKARCRVTADYNDLTVSRGQLGR